MFINKWTLHVNQPGQVEEWSFESKASALQYVRQLKAQNKPESMTLKLVNPQGAEEALDWAEAKQFTAKA